MTVWVDGAPLAANIDIVKEVGLNTAVSFSGIATASSTRMNVTITSSVRTPTGYLWLKSSLHRTKLPFVCSHF